MFLARYQYLLILLPIVLATVSISNAQNTTSSALACVNISEGSRVFYKAMYLLQGYQYGLEVTDCLQKDYKEADSLDPISRVKLGIQLLELIKTDDSQLRLTSVDLKFFIASAKIKLSKLYLEKNESGVSAKLLKDAREMYLSIVPPEVKTENADLLIKISVGLIRSHNSFDALQVLNKLNTNDPARSYLTAEIYFSSGNRELAATEYERWIRLGCRSEYSLLLGDEFGERWFFALSLDPPNVTLCEQLPAELFARLQALKAQYGHPDNLPNRHYPATFFPTKRL